MSSIDTAADKNPFHAAVRAEMAACMAELAECGGWRLYRRGDVFRLSFDGGEDQLIVLAPEAGKGGVNLWAGWAGEGATATWDELFHPYELGQLVDNHEALTNQIFLLLADYFEDAMPADGFAGVDGFH